MTTTQEAPQLLHEVSGTLLPNPTYVDGVLTCVECGKQGFADLRGFRAHQRSHIKVACPFCGESQTANGLPAHKKWCDKRPTGENDQTPIEELSLDSRPLNLLKGVGIDTVAQLVTKIDLELMAIPGFGFAQLTNVKKALAKFDYQLKPSGRNISINEALARQQVVRDPETGKMTTTTKKRDRRAPRLVAPPEPAAPPAIIAALDEEVKKVLAPYQERIVAMRLSMQEELTKIEGRRQALAAQIRHLEKVEQTFTATVPNGKKQHKKRDGSQPSTLVHHRISEERIAVVLAHFRARPHSQMTVSDVAAALHWPKSRADAATKHLRQREQLRFCGMRGRNYLFQYMENGS